MRRTTRIFAGYFAACLVAALVVPAALTFVATFWDSAAVPEGFAPIPPANRSIEWWSSFRAAAPIILVYISLFALAAAPVALPAIWVAERRFIQTPAYYGWAGFFAGAIMSGVHAAGFGVRLTSILIFLFFGLLGVFPALTYWLIAGRSTGD